MPDQALVWAVASNLLLLLLAMHWMRRGLLEGEGGLYVTSGLIAILTLALLLRYLDPIGGYLGSCRAVPGDGGPDVRRRPLLAPPGGALMSRRRLAALVAAVLLQLAVLGGLFVYSQYPLWVGTEVRFWPPLPVDPARPVPGPVHVPLELRPVPSASAGDGTAPRR